jgi:hypothetical protein
VVRGIFGGRGWRQREDKDDDDDDRYYRRRVQHTHGAHIRCPYTYVHTHTYYTRPSTYYTRPCTYVHTLPTLVHPRPYISSIHLSTRPGVQASRRPLPDFDCVDAVQCRVRRRRYSSAISLQV